MEIIVQSNPQRFTDVDLIKEIIHAIATQFIKPEISEECKCEDVTNIPIDENGKCMECAKIRDKIGYKISKKGLCIKRKNNGYCSLSNKHCPPKDEENCEGYDE